MIECQSIRWFDFRRVLMITHGVFTVYVYIESIRKICKDTYRKKIVVTLTNDDEYIANADDVEDGGKFYDGI